MRVHGAYYVHRKLLVVLLPLILLVHDIMELFVVHQIHIICKFATMAL